MISLIVAMSEKSRVIGRENALPWSLPADLKRFRAVTMGKPVLMGRKTFESIGKPLPGRRNVVVSRSGFQADGVEVFRTLEEALEAVRDQPEIMVIGGAQIYAQALPFADRLYRTLVSGDHAGDAFFPEIRSEEWTETASEPHEGFVFQILDRVSGKQVVSG